MKIAQKSINRITVVLAFLSTIALLAAFPWLLTNIFSATYLPHGFCFMWNPQLLWLHVISDVVIGISYLVIATTLAWLIQTCRREVPFQSIFVAFGAFILACGFTHMIAVVVLWKPLYWLEGDVKLLTACASLITAIVLPIYLPRIREMVKSAKASAENERRFLAAANSSLDSVYILKSERSISGEIEDFTFLFVNPNAARLINRQPEQILGQRICELIPFNRSSGIFDKYKQVVETSVGFKEEFSISDKEIRASWLKIQAVKLDDGVAITSSDITARKRLEFERTKAFTQSLIDSSPATIIVTDLSYTITAINPAAQRMLWYKPEELIGKQTPLIFYDVDELEERSAKLSDKFGTHVSVNEVIFFISRAQNVDDEAEWNFIRKGGSRVAVQVTVTPLVGEGAEDSGFMITAYDVSERKRREEYISHIAQHDSLTGLPTRHLLFDRLEMAIARAKRATSICALLMLDVNDFKGVNDSFGHHAGDVLLMQMASRFRASLRATDTVARMGGDEFVILLDDLHSLDEAVVVANQLCDAISSPFILSALSTISVSISVGISVYPESGSDAGSLLRNADVAMYQAKAGGQPYIEVYTPALAQSSLHKQEVAAGLRDALHNGEFELHYQPQLDLKEARVLGFECLLRWTNPRLGSVSPSIFIPIAEETGLIQPIGAWVVKQACKDLRRIQTRFTDELFVSVNISPRQVEQKHLLQIIADAIEESEIAPGTLEIEITEGVLMKDSAVTTALLDGLHKLGSRIAIDDFGTGFSNMSYLLRLPIDCLKIDRSIVDGCSTGSSTSTITSAIIALAHQLNLCVVAEGAELREEVQFLKTQDCDRVQGFYFSKPLSLDTILAIDLDSFGQRDPLVASFKHPNRISPPNSGT